MDVQKQGNSDIIVSSVRNMLSSLIPTMLIHSANPFENAPNSQNKQEQYLWLYLRCQWEYDKG